MSSRPTRNRRELRTLAGSIALALIVAASASAGEPRTLELFDGKSLDGWEKTDFYKAGKVEVADGAIVMHKSEALGGMTGITTRREDLPKTNYELTYEARRLGGSDFFAAATFPVGDGFLTLVNGGWGGNVTGLSSIDGMDASENETGGYFKYENDRWYTFRVRVTDKVVRCWIGDERVAGLETEGHRLTTRLEVRSNEPLGFATWETSGALRKVRIRELSDEEVAKTDEAKDE
jgi:hypothetical protein